MQRVPIYKKKFWRDLRVEIVRARKDRRSRRSLLVRLGFLAYSAGVLFYYGTLFYSFHDPATAVGLAVALLMMIGIVAANRYGQHREAKKHLAADFASVPGEVTGRVQRLAHGLAAMTERALGERWLAHNTVPEGHIVISRRITIDTLKEFGVWEEMPSSAREWMMRPDGCWPAERVTRVLAIGELLNTLLWGLGLQDSLRDTEELLSQLSMKRLAKALRNPAPGIRPTWDLRLERDRAMNYYWRCYAEQVHRGEVKLDDVEQESAIKQWMSEISEHPDEDVLAGTSTVRELAQHAVWQASLSSALRGHSLTLLMRLLDQEDVWDELNTCVYGPLVSDQKEPA